MPLGAALHLCSLQTDLRVRHRLRNERRQPARRRRRSVAMEAGPSPADPERPQCHVMARRGWLNDPNGPVYHNGVYHLFYQHLPTGCEWDWGLVWGHAVSSDLVHWEHLPPAIVPTPGKLDADGCFSGCCTIDADGVPTIMYTGVRLRSNQECGPLPPTECDLQLPFIESQLLARALDPKDKKLQRWLKQESPFLALPPPNIPLTGWRDPFVIQRGVGGKDWIILMGAGLKDQGGTTMIYRAKELAAPWQYDGLLCIGEPSQGVMWECPLLWRIEGAPDPPDPGGAGPARTVADASHELAASAIAITTGSDVFAEPCARLQKEVSRGAQKGPTVDADFAHFYCVSPDAPTNPVIYWMGHYDAATVKFRLQGAAGPYRLDLGDTIYAPNILEDSKGRCVLWAWVQEHRTVGSYDFSGCMATPRVLLQRDRRLIQQPLPELKELRRKEAVQWPPTEVPEGVRMPLEGLTGQAFDIEVVLHRGSSYVAGLMLQSWSSGQGSAAILYDWENSLLEVVYEGLDPETMTYSLSGPAVRRVGGRLDPPNFATIALRIVLDHSLLEIFTGTGQVITTRVYRGEPPGADAGVDFISFGGALEVASLHAWELDTIWKAPQATKQPKTAGGVASVTQKIERLDIGGPGVPRAELQTLVDTDLAPSPPDAVQPQALTT